MSRRPLSAPPTPAISLGLELNRPVPLAGFYPAVAVAVQAFETLSASVDSVVNRLSAPCPGTHFVSRQHAVVVPILVFKGLYVAAPFVLGNDAVIVAVHSTES